MTNTYSAQDAKALAAAERGAVRMMGGLNYNWKTQLYTKGGVEVGFARFEGGEVYGRRADISGLRSRKGGASGRVHHLDAYAIEVEKEFEYDGVTYHPGELVVENFRLACSTPYAETEMVEPGAEVTCKSCLKYLAQRG